MPERYTKIEKISLEGTAFISHPEFPKKVKNLKIRFKYSFLDHVSTNDWIGIHIRTQGPQRNNSELIYSRVNGELESLSWPAYKPPIEGEPATNEESSDGDIFEISVIENKLDVRTNSKSLNDENVFADGFGDIMIGTQAHTPDPGMEEHRLTVECTGFEIINLDTTAPI